MKQVILLTIGLASAMAFPPTPIALAQVSAPAPVATQADGASAAGEARLGGIAISGGFARAMLPGQTVGGAYLAITNGGTASDRLLSAAMPGARRSEVHEMSMDGAVMRMRPLAGGLEIPAGETVELKPGGLHLMFSGLAAPFVKGSTVAVTLLFEEAGSIEIELPVLDPSASGAATGADEHSGHPMAQ